MEMDLYNDTYNFFCGLLTNANPKILEIGCGPGNITRYVLSKITDAKIQGIDISPKMVELAKKNNPSANFKVMDCRAIDKLEPGFEAIICGFCIPYLSQSECSKLVQDCRSILLEKGILYLSFVEGDYENSGYITGGNGNKLYFYYHDIEELRRYLTKNKFSILNPITINYPKSEEISEKHIILIAKKK